MSDTASSSSSVADEDFEIVDGKLHISGYRYYTSGKPKKGRQYWECELLRDRQCTARAITMDTAAGTVLLKGPTKKPHEHPPNLEKCQAEKITVSLKRKARQNPELPPAVILRNELPNVPQAVLSQMASQPNLTKSMRRERRRDLPANPTSLEDLGEIPDRYKNSLTGEKFLIFDSLLDPEIENFEGRGLVFATRRNLELLSQSPTWYLDGTFKVSPSLFTQVNYIIIHNLKIKCSIPLFNSYY